MRAIHLRSYGGPDKLQLVHIQEPQPAQGQLAVRVFSSSVNPIDWKRASGAYRLIMPVQFPSIPGYDIAGEVMALGSGVTGFAVGDRVHARIAEMSGGASAEVAVVGVEVTTKMPEGMTFADAAALPLAGMTALQGLRDGGKLTFFEGTNKRVLIIGGSGGAGHFAVQIARAMGAHVTSVSSAKNAEVTRSLGAHETIDYNASEPFAGQAPFDVIYDCVAGEPGKYNAHLTPQGRYLSCVPGPSVFAYATMNFLRKKHVGAVMLKANAADLAVLDDLFARGKLRVLIDAHFPLERLRDAWEHSIRGRSVGKIVIDVRA
jgi:NADPH:quinone reductase-like Zn-dependent oxidoreductase